MALGLRLLMVSRWTRGRWPVRGLGSMGAPVEWGMES